MNGGFFDKTKLPDSYLNLLHFRKKGYIYHFELYYHNSKKIMESKRFMKK